MKREIEVWKVSHEGREAQGFPGKPLEDLYEWGLPYSPYNSNKLAFAGDGLLNSSLFESIEEIVVSFYNKDDTCQSQRDWADPLRYEILKRLSGDQYYWYIGYRTCWEMAIFDRYSKILLDMHIPYLRLWSLSELVFVDSGYEIGSGKGVVQKPVFEVKSKDLESFVAEVWPVANPAFSIEGYCMKPNSLEILYSWNKKERTPELFRRVIDECLVLFFTNSHGPRHLHFITNKMKASELADIINLADLIRKARQL